MRKYLKKCSLLLPLALLLAMVFSATAFAGTASTTAANSTWTGATTGWTNARTAATTGARLVRTYAPNTILTVYATVSGQVVWGGIRTWYRVSSLNSSPLYVYGGLLKRTSSTGSGGSGGTPSPGSAQGKVIIVNRANNVQRLYAYDHGKLVFTTPVTTGSLYLQTFLGTWHIYRKLTNVTFYSPWPKSSPYYFAPEHVDYALDYDGALYIHSATWRSVFGPGTDRRHWDPKFGWMDGSHGCVNTPLSAAKWLYNWAAIGTTVKIID
ncbi:MAG TPA: L,D-transpeptidase [Ktedonobacteraceae bacterium]|nr:L,D-transpeptidase [Ktedonobacteraceae bacterium]